MALVEYKPGTAFPGVMGRTIKESSPAWPSPVRARDGAPNVLFIVLDDAGFAQLGCFGSPSARRTWMGWRPDGLRFNNMHTTALCSPSRSCMLTGATTTRTGCRASPRGQRATRAERAHPVRGRLAVGDAARARLQHVRDRQMAPDAAEQISAAGPYERWPLGRGFERYYGSWGATPASTIRTWCTTTTRSTRRRLRKTAITSTKTSTRPSSSSATPSNQRRQAVLPLLRHRAEHAPHQVPKAWAEVQGRFDEGWDACRDKVFARQKDLGILPEERAVAARSGCAGLEDAARGRAGLYARMMEVSPGSSRTPITTSAADRLSTRLGGLDNTLIVLISDNGATRRAALPGSTR